MRATDSFCYGTPMAAGSVRYARLGAPRSLLDRFTALLDRFTALIKDKEKVRPK